jgi:hypothetical protein
MLTYRLLKTQNMLLSATSRKDQPDADLHSVKSPEHPCQQQAGRASQMLTYILFKTQSTLLSATSRKGQPDADLHTIQNQCILLSATSRKSQPDANLQPFQNPEHAPVSSK